MERITVSPRDACWMILYGAAPANMHVDGSLDLDGWTALTALPEGLSVGGSLYLTDCTSLTALPEGLSVGGSLDLTGCVSLTALPHRIRTDGQSGRAVAHSDYLLIWTGEHYIAGCRYLTPREALEHWGGPHRRDARARIFHAAITAHQKEIAA